MDECAGVLRQRGLPHQVRKGAGSFDPAADTIKVLTMHASKGLELLLVALVGAGRMHGKRQDKRDEARVVCGGHAGDAAADFGCRRAARVLGAVADVKNLSLTWCCLSPRALRNGLYEGKKIANLSDDSTTEGLD